MLKELMAVALERGTPLTSRELFESSYRWYSAMRKTPLRKLLGGAARAVLGEKARDRYSDAQRIFAIVMLEACWKEGDRALLSDSLASENPFIRRAAWHALGLRQPDAFLENIQTVARDTSEWVRMVVPGVYDAQGSSQKIYFDVETVVDGLDSYGSSRNRKRLPKPVVDILNQMGGDAALQVRRAAAFCLLANREKTDVRALAAMVADERGGREMAYRVSSILEELPVTWLRELGTGDVLALLDAVDAADEDNERSRTLRKKLVVESAAPVVKPAVVTRKREAGLVVASGAEPVRREATQGDGAVARRLVVFFRNPGCKDCERVAEWLGALRAEFPDMAVEELDIRKPDDARVHEVLSERFEVPDRYHLTAPAIFCGGGYLIKGEITFERLGRLLGREESTETQWRQVDPVAMARADEVLGKHYAAMGPWMVAGAGLLDGVNPCAFATIIFLLSYLQVTRRTRGEILRVGSAFVAGVFIAYFLLGLGMVEVVVRFALLRRLGVALNWTMAGFVAVVAVLSAWDGVQCLRGRMGDMVLQLPGVLKAGIHAAVRRSVRQRQLVLAAFGAGLVIAVLELACTGQVYLPTLVYMLKTGQDHEGAVGLLFLYNVAFVVPLLVVFAGAYGGLRSERLTLWLQRRAALVKFALALLFAGLFMLFVFGALV
jgi:cytochrome c biogenesis protein CcdA